QDQRRSGRDRAGRYSHAANRLVLQSAAGCLLPSGQNPRGRQFRRHGGGYRDFRDLYAQNVFAQDGGQQGVREHEDHVALYYAMRRHADGIFNAKTGRYDGISSAYRMKLVPVFVVDPDKPMDIPSRESEEGRKKSYDVTSAAMIKAVNTLVPQEV